MQEKERKYMLQIFSWEEKQKYHITSRSSKLYWERFLQCDLCYSDDHFIFLREKESKLLCWQEEQKGKYIYNIRSIFLSTNNKSVMPVQYETEKNVFATPPSTRIYFLPTSRQYNAVSWRLKIAIRWS